MAQHPNRFMGGGDNGPTQPSRFHLAQQPHREEGFATARVTAQHKRNTGILVCQPGLKQCSCRLLIVGKDGLRGLEPAHPLNKPNVWAK